MTFPARSASRISKSSPISQWALGSKSNLRGSPQRRISGFSLSSLPIGTSSLGIFGICSRISRNSVSISRSCPSSSPILLPTSRISAEIAAVSCPAFFIAPICLETVLRLVLSCSVSLRISRRFFSSSVKPSKLSGLLRFLSIVLTTSRLSRTNLISNITLPPMILVYIF